MKFTKQFICLLYLTVIGVPVSAQIVIGTTTPSPSAVLELNSTSAGFLVPRMTYAQMNAIASPAEGLTVYCIDCEPKGLYYFDGDTFLSGITGSGPEVVSVTSTTGRVWMDRNLGATRAAVSVADAASYGDLYQWGRAADGHEKRVSATTVIRASTAEPNSGGDWDGMFIITNQFSDWLISTDNTLWQDVNGVNNPCPSGYRLPTQIEWAEEYGSWNSQNASGAFNTPLKLLKGGARLGFNSSNQAGGTILSMGTGFYWSSTTVGGNSARYMSFNNNVVNISTTSTRSMGYSVRCIKDE